jgi:hypothetical protein
MFSIKFFKDNNENTVSAPHYSIEKYEHGVGITVYKNYYDDDGVERIVGEDDYDVCFIENSAGKTINRISAK